MSNTKNCRGREARHWVSFGEPKLSLNEKASAGSLGQSCDDFTVQTTHQVSCESSGSAHQNSNLCKTRKSRLEDPWQDEQGERVKSAMMKKGNLDRYHEGIPDEYKQPDFSKFTLLQWTVLVVVMATLACSLIVPVLKRKILWGLHLWKWVVMILVLVCGHLVSTWGTHFLIFFIESFFLSHERLVCLTYGLRKSVQNWLWLGMVLISWEIDFNEKVDEETNSEVLVYVTKGLLCLFVGNSIWLLKTLLLKVFALSFHMKSYFDKMDNAFFKQKMIRKLLMRPPPSDETTDSEEAGDPRCRLTVPPMKGWWTGAEGINKKSPNKGMTTETETGHNKSNATKDASLWRLKNMIDILRNKDLCILDELKLDLDEDIFMLKIQRQAEDAAKMIFQNVFHTSGSQYINKEVLMHFMDEKESSRFIDVLHGTAKEIDQLSFQKWMMVVEEMNILTTVFWKSDDQKIIYPNSELATKPISNYHRGRRLNSSTEERHRAREAEHTNKVYREPDRTVLTPFVVYNDQGCGGGCEKAGSGSVGEAHEEASGDGVEIV